jgi:hypothetical protein
VDGLFPGYACGAGLTCNRQNEWYWQVGVHTVPLSLMGRG